MSTSFDENSQAPLPPPSGDAKKAEKYINQLIELVNKDKLHVVHTDLKKFDPGSLQDHYQLELNDYQVEISHSKHPDTGKDFYNILFNNLKQIKEGCSEKTILAYMHLTQDQFQRFADAGSEQLSRRKKEEEEKRFQENIKPIDDILESLSSEEKKAIETQENPVLPIDEELKEETPAPAESTPNPFADVFEKKIDEAIEEQPANTQDNKSLLDAFTKPNPLSTQE